MQNLVGKKFYSLSLTNAALQISLGAEGQIAEILMIGAIDIKTELRHWLGLVGICLIDYFEDDNFIDMKFENGTQFYCRKKGNFDVSYSSKTNTNFHLAPYKVLEGLTILTAAVDDSTSNLLLTFDDNSRMCVFNEYKLKPNIPISSLKGRKIDYVTDDNITFTMNLIPHTILEVQISEREPEAMVYAPSKDLGISCMVWN